MKHISLISLVLALLIPVCLSAQERRRLPRLFEQTDNSKMNRWVEQQMASLDIEKQIGQLIMPIVYPSTKETDIRAVKSLVQQGFIGGILYQKGTLASQYEMNRLLQQTARIPLLVTLDGEYGLWMRLKDAPRYPRNMAIGHISDKRYIYQYGREIAQQCRLMGIHCNFAPDVDVNNNPQNPVIGTRSFGTTPLDVAANGLAYSLGLEDGGVLSVAKHFPGHGNTDIDSHKALPTISGSRAQLEATELYPFKEYISARMGGIMVGHLRVPSLSPDGSPASMSKAIISDLLIRDMGFEGLIFTDAMEMKGMQTADALPVSVRALRAGADILLGPTNVTNTIREIRAAIQSGQLIKDDIAAKCRKLLRYKYQLIVNNPIEYTTKASEIKTLINSPKVKAFCQALWYRSIKVKRGADLLPLQPTNTGIIHLGTSSPNALTQALTQAGFTNHYYYSKASQTDQSKILKAVANTRTIVIAIYGDARTEYDAFAAQLSRMSQSIVCLFATPFASLKLPRTEQAAKAWIDAYENCTEAHEATAQRLISNAAPQYSLPHPTDAEQSLGAFPLFQIKESTTNPPSSSPSIQISTAQPSRTLQQRVDAIALEGLKQGAYPGCRIMAMHKDKVLIDASYGNLTNNGSERVNQNTVYDLASITKAAATTPAIMLLVADRKIKLTDQIGKILPRFANTSLRDITIEDLLLHRSGLIPTINFYTDLIDKDSYTPPLISFKARTDYVHAASRTWCNPRFRFLPSLVSDKASARYNLQMAHGIFLSDSVHTLVADRIAAQTPRTSKAYRYSDVNFVLLQFVIEAVAQEPMDSFLQRHLYKPIATNLCYNPLLNGIPVHNIAPTQEDNFLRKQIIRGTVDDETAACLGGVGGNAGLFGTAADLMTLLQLYQAEGSFSGKEVISRKIFRQFLNTTDKKNYRSLGFDKARDGASTAAASASSLTYGHNGFTGTCFWVDPEYDIVFVFLSNRTYPSRTNTKLMTMKIRQRIHQALYDSLLAI